MNDEAIEQIKTPGVKQKTATTPLIIFGTGLGILLSNLIKPLMDYLNISSSSTVNIGIIVSLMLIALIFRLLLININKKNLHQVVNVKSLSEEKVTIVPKSSTYILKFIATYAFIVIFTIFIGSALILNGNIMILFIFFLLFFSLLHANTMTVVLQQDYQVTFVRKDRK